MLSTRATRSIPALVPPTGNSKRILREQELSFGTVYNHKGFEHISDSEREPIQKLD